MLIVTEHADFAQMIAYNVVIMLGETAVICSWEEAENHIASHTHYLLDLPGIGVNPKKLEPFDREGCAVVLVSTFSFRENDHHFKRATVRVVSKPAPVRQYIVRPEESRSRVGW